MDFNQVSTAAKKTMRDALLERIYTSMKSDESIFFLSADFGAPVLDRIRNDFPSRFINVGIAEQNLIGVSSGLALEGMTVYAYAIASFLTMRAFEQIRNNLSLLSKHRSLNVNLVGVGTGISYDMSGPSHHCLEDLAIMQVLPGISIFSPSDYLLAESFVDYSLKVKSPKYIRLDGKPQPALYNGRQIDIEKGFCELLPGSDACIVSTGYMTHRALNVADSLKDKKQIGVIDAYMLKPFNTAQLINVLSRYKSVITLEECFINRGGLDCLVLNALNSAGLKVPFKAFGVSDEYIFKSGHRDQLAEDFGFGEKNLTDYILSA